MADSLPPLPKGKFFYISERESGLVLEIQNAKLEQGTPVVLGSRRDMRSEPVESLCQMWHNCLVTNTVRCRANANLAFTLTGSGEVGVGVVAEEEGRYLPSQHQVWTFDVKKGIIHGSVSGEHRFLLAAGRYPGSAVIASDGAGQNVQQFVAEYLDTPYFVLVSMMSGLCMEVDTGLFGGVKEGHKVLTCKRDEKDPQLWFEDMDGVLRTKVGGFAMECLKEPGAAMRTAVYSRPRGTQHWHLMPNYTVYNRDRPGYCLDIAQRKNKDGAKVVVWKCIGAKSQQWKRDFDIYSKKKKGKSTKISKKSDDSHSDEEGEC